MSKWTIEFENHPFQQTWLSLKEQVDQITLDDESVETDVAEVARLRKVVAYLSDLLENIDPELTPSSTWKNFNAQATPCLAEVTSYNSNRNIGHITNANAHADNLLTYVRPYMVLPKMAAEALSSSGAAYVKTAEDYIYNIGEKVKLIVAEVDALKTKAETSSVEIEKSKSNVGDLEILLFGEDKASGLKKEFNELLTEVTTHHDAINEAYNELLVGEGDVLSTKQEIVEAKSESIKKQKEIEQLLAAASAEITELEKFHATIFGKVKDDGTRAGGLDKNLEALKTKLVNFEKEQSERYTALNKEIESLLPGATSAGLATAYREMKDSFNKPIRNSSILFYISVATLVIASFVLAVQSIGWWFITFKPMDTWDSIFRAISYKLPFIAPVVWLAFYATKRRSEAQRLQQEYAHKEALAKSYNSYKKQITELGEKDDKLLTELIRKAIEAISHNASATLDGKHGDKMPAQEVIDLATKLNTK